MSRVSLILCLWLSAAALYAAPGPTRAAARIRGAHQQFVLDASRAAVALPQPDPQDRLRVLAAAAQLVSPISHALERQYAREGARLESELIAAGQQPSTSMLAAGRVDCATAAQFLEGLRSENLPAAEQSVIGIVSSCPRLQGLAGRKLADAIETGALAPRAILALSERTGLNSRWSLAQFGALFANLPSGAGQQSAEFAQVFAAFAPAIPVDQARDSGLRLLRWLATIRDDSARSLAVRVTTIALREALGQERYIEALRSDATASALAASIAGQHDFTPAADPFEEENVSVLAALSSPSDRTNSLTELKPAPRARQAAALGFAAAGRGDRRAAERFLDLAFSAAEDVWTHRADQRDAPAVLQEVSEAAAQVDFVAAMQRAQRLADPTAQAISILAVARVVLGKEDR